jgi:osmotically-inducible protein OsmY
MGWIIACPARDLGSETLTAVLRREISMKVAKTAKKSAKGWAAFKVGRGAAKGAGRAVKRKARRGPSTQERVAKIAGAVGITAAIGIVLAKIDRRKAAGKAKSAVSGRKDYDDVTLARKVESELFRPADVPKGSISVNVNDGVVELRGELSDQKQIDELGDTAKKIDGVKDVRNLLHTAGSTNGG